MRQTPGNALAILVVGLLAGCSSHHASSEGPLRPGDVAPQAVALLRFGVDEDGSLTRAKVVAVLKKEFAAADTNHDGVLEPDEVNAVNDRRWKKDGEKASLLIDWNRDGVVDFKEFATTDLSLFEQFDANGDGVVTAQEFTGKKRNIGSP
jgi:Ca2+-binding EF-hand superfamily protein